MISATDNWKSVQRRVLTGKIGGPTQERKRGLCSEKRVGLGGSRGLSKNGIEKRGLF